MGRTCIACGRERPNENFASKGVRSVVCRQCRQRRKEEDWKGDLAIDEMFGFLRDQKNISEKNMKRLGKLCSFPKEKVRVIAQAVLEAAKAHPRRKGRIPYLHNQCPELWKRLVELHIFEEWVEWPEYEGPGYFYSDECMQIMDEIDNLGPDYLYSDECMQIIDEIDNLGPGSDDLPF